MLQPTLLIPPQPRTTTIPMTSENHAERPAMKTTRKISSTRKPHLGHAMAGPIVNDWLIISRPFGISVMGWSTNSNSRIGGCSRRWNGREHHFCDLQKLVSAGRDGQTRRGVHHRRRGIQQPVVRCFTEHDHAARMLTLDHPTLASIRTSDQHSRFGNYARLATDTMHCADVLGVNLSS
jgi:hypothetical protein